MTDPVPAPPLPPPEKSRTWFVVLAWITLILFGMFVAWITILSATLPRLKQANQERSERPAPPSWEEER